MLCDPRRAHWTSEQRRCPPRGHGRAPCRPRGDLVKGQRAAWEWDRKMAQARKALDWDEQIQLALDSPLAAELRRAKNPSSQENCSMCGPYCAMRLVDEHLKER